MAACARSFSRSMRSDGFCGRAEDSADIAHLFVVRLARALHGLSGFADRSSGTNSWGGGGTHPDKATMQIEDARHRRAAAGREAV